MVLIGTNMNFENALTELETLVKKMETGQLSLEDSLKYFEEGIELGKKCQTSLKEAEQKVDILMKKSGNSSELSPFNLDNET